jgi:preprotein translocase subunit YajC
VTPVPLYAFLAPSGQQSGATTMIFMFQILAFIAIFWFLLIRPQRQQQKRHQELLKALKKGDEVITSGGIVGKIVHLKDDRVTVESAESRFVVMRDRVTGIITGGTIEEPVKK